MATKERQNIAYAAVRVARMYYFQNMTTAAIAEEIGTSRATVSRMLSYALEHGLVEIRIHNPAEQTGSLENTIRDHFQLGSVQVAPVPSNASDEDALRLVAIQAASYLNTLVRPSTILGLAWGKTIRAIANHLTPHPVHDMDVVQLNGSATGATIVNDFGESIVARFAQNFGARAHSFHVPAFFDYPETRQYLWRERSIQAIHRLQDNATILLFSIGADQTGSHIHTGGYLDAKDREGIRHDNVVGDIATVFFRGDGSWRDVALNARSSGPDLDHFQDADHSICVVCGKGKIPGLKAALLGGFINELIIDEPTARLLADSIDTHKQPAGASKQLIHGEMS